MTTVVEKTIKSSGGDYSSLAAWEAGQQGDLTVSDTIQKAGIYSFSDTSRVTFDGWTTSVTQHIWLYVPTTERHNGTWSATKARLEYTATTTYDNVMHIYEDYITIEGMQISFTANGFTGGYGAYVSAATATSNKIKLINNIFKMNNAGTAASAFFNPHPNTNVVIAKNIFYDINTFVFYFYDGLASARVYNNTFYNCTTGIDARNLGSNKTIAKNNLFKSVTTACVGTFAAGTDYNATNNASLNYTVTGGGNTHDQLSRTFTFVNEGAYDLHLASTDTGATGLGVDLSADADYAFNDDIDSQTITGAWSIGADKYMINNTYTRTISESITTTDSPLRNMQAYRQIPLDSITMDELLLKSTQFGRIASDQITITESMQRAAYLYRQTNDTAIINDGLLRYAQLIRKLLEQFEVTDTLTVAITVGGVIIVSRILSDNINIDDLIMRTVKAYRKESQSLDVYDGTWYSASVLRQAIEVLTASEVIAKSLQRSRVIADTTDISDIAFRYALLNRLLHEDAEASDSLVAQITYFQQLLGFIMQTLEKEPILYKNTVAMNIETDLTENTGIRMELTKI